MRGEQNLSTLNIEEREDRLVVELHRPDAKNAINDDMVVELHGVCEGLEQDPRILIITGARNGSDTVFSAGADIRRLLARGREEALQGINSNLFSRIARLPMPVIAAVDGFAIGGGAELAYAADVRIASTRAVFGNPEAGLGILAAAGATWRLLELVGEPLAKEMLFTGRNVTAEEALQRGLVSAVHEPEDIMDAVHALVDRIAKQDALAVRVTKRVLATPRAAHPFVDDLAQAILFESEEKERRMWSFLKRSERSQ